MEKQSNQAHIQEYHHQVYPNEHGRFGAFGGQFVPENLMTPLANLEATYIQACEDEAFQATLSQELSVWVGRPTPLLFVPRFSACVAPGVKVYLKREDLAHTGSHKVNSALGQGLLARRMGKRRIVAETSSGQHGVAVAAVCAKLGLQCTLYIGEFDALRQPLNVLRMKLLEAEVRIVTTGTRKLKDAANEAMRDLITHIETTFYLARTTIGPHPYPRIVRDFQSIIGREARKQILEQEGRLPDLILACVGGGSNALGIFHPFVDATEVKLIGIEAGGVELTPGHHASPLVTGRPGVFHGTLSYLLHDTDGQIQPTASIAAGLDYPGAGPEHSYLKDSGRATYDTANDATALRGFQVLSRTEGIVPSLEASHALGYLLEQGKQGIIPPGALIIVNLSGHGEKDLWAVMNAMKQEKQ